VTSSHDGPPGIPDLGLRYAGGTVLPKGKRKSKAKAPPVSTICPVCLRFLSDHAMRERRQCAKGVDDRDDDQ
jgi:hypothetical protein